MKSRMSWIMRMTSTMTMSWTRMKSLTKLTMMILWMISEMITMC